MLVFKWSLNFHKNVKDDCDTLLLHRANKQSDRRIKVISVIPNSTYFINRKLSLDKLKKIVVIYNSIKSNLFLILVSNWKKDHHSTTHLLIIDQDRPQGWPVIWSSACATHRWGKTSKCNKDKGTKGALNATLKCIICVFLYRYHGISENRQKNSFLTKKIWARCSSFRCCLKS